ncbi:hypothetical protein [Bacteroides caccae]|uniref:hypothetical protein n=1 Tax=Bacteroides caccae TaxID=47678 RepID=UPI0034A5B666
MLAKETSPKAIATKQGLINLLSQSDLFENDVTLAANIAKNTDPIIHNNEGNNINMHNFLLDNLLFEYFLKYAVIKYRERNPINSL